MHDRISRRRFGRIAAAGALAAAGAGLADERAKDEFRLRYILGSSMYGKTNVDELLPEVAKMGASHIDIWPMKHGNQREQVEAMGLERFAELLRKHGVELGIITRYDLGPFGLQKEMPVAKKLGARMLICNARGKKGLTGDELDAAVKSFCESMRPHIEAAEKHGLVIGIENHSGTLLSSSEAIRRFREHSKSKTMGLALAPYHLPQDPKLLAKLITELDDQLVHFYAWQHGKGCMTKLPKSEELEQMPGRGTLDFAPMLAALKKIDYRGWTEVFMHPVPRGIPILGTTVEVTEEINRARKYLEARLRAS